MNQTQSPTRPGTLEEAKAQGLTEQEFKDIHDVLGRDPNVTELAIFAVMWSEHCSYKNSIIELKKLPREGGALLVSAGEENAGMVDIGDGWAVVFKIESHNHPSAVEPFQGAATGVGGILRDIFTMGARPIAALDSLHFGDINNSHTRFLLDGVVRGIGHYGNCFGVPTVAGEVSFDPAYGGNPLVNAMAVGVLKAENMTRAKANGVGNRVFYVGSRTGRDGIHGATFASEELSGDDDAKRPSVQVGDPFAEKLLLEATLELAASGAMAAIQDMGAAGLTCSSCEMSAAGEVGMTIDLDKVPLRETDMEPWEIMLSESQERMLLVAKPGREDEIKQVFEKWDLEVSDVGEVTADGRLRINYRGNEVVDIPAWNTVLGGGAPQYERESTRPARLDEMAAFDLGSLPDPDDYSAVLLKLMADPAIASKRWVFEQYDQSVRTNTALEPGYGDAAVVRVEGTNKGLAVKTDAKAHMVALEPYRGAELTVCEAALNVACTGARPVAITNCLNFGHPYKPEVYYFFKEATAGMGNACRELETPVTGGNVSFYNETLGKAVLPTPTIGMLGVLKNVDYRIGSVFKEAGNAVYLLGENQDSGLGGSSYLRIMHDRFAGALPNVNYNNLLNLIELLVGGAEAGIISSAHDISDGGLAVTLAECCIMDRNNPIGADIKLADTNGNANTMYGEAPHQVVVSIKPDNVSAFEEMASREGVNFSRIGETGGSRLRIDGFIDLDLGELNTPYHETLPQLMGS